MKSKLDHPARQLRVSNMAAHPYLTGTSRWSAQTARYLTVGAIAGLTDLLVYTTLAQLLGVHPPNAHLVSRPIGGLVSFTLNKYWTFGNRGRASTPRQALRYLTIWFACYAASRVLLGFYYSTLQLAAVPAKLAAECTVGIFSFLSQKFWTFR